MAGRIAFWVVVIAALGGVAGLFWWRSQQIKKPEATVRLPRVKVQRPGTRDLPIRLTYPAELEAIQAADIRPIEAKGFVRKLTVDKGSKIRRGQLLALVDCPEYHALRKQASEGIRSSRAIYKNAKITLDRLAPMRARNFVSQLDIDNAQAAYEGAEARLKNDEARLAEVDHLLGYCEIRAPFDGEVTMRFIDPGEPVRPGGPPLLTVVRRSVMRVQLHVVERDAALLREGLPVELTVHGLSGESFHGKVTRVVRSLDPRTRTLFAEIEIPNPDGALKPGMFGRVSLVVDRHRRAVMVPATALLATDAGTWVYVVIDGLARRLPVKVGHDVGEEVEVTEGLRGSEWVVVMGRDLIREGAAVQVAAD
jgi:RND family efflux transporter MFP subunit